MENSKKTCRERLKSDGDDYLITYNTYIFIREYISKFEPICTKLRLDLKILLRSVNKYIV